MLGSETHQFTVYPLNEPAAGNPDAVIEALVRAGGRVNSKFAIVKSDEKGQYGVALEDIAEGEEIFFGPWSALLAGKGTTGSDGRSDYSGKLALVSALIDQKRDIEYTGNAVFGAYVRELPGVGLHRNALDVRDDEMAVKCRSEGSTREGKTFETQYQKVETTLLKKTPKAKGRGGRYTPEEVRWAYSNVVSRHTHFDEFETSYLLPVWDFFNHDSQRFNLHSNATRKDGVFFYTTREIKKGEELLNTYGTHLSPYKIMAFYGFVDKSKAQIRSFLSFDTDAVMESYGCNEADKVNVFVQNGSLTDATLRCLTLAGMGVKERKAFVKMSAAEKKRKVLKEKPSSLRMYSEYVDDVINQGHPEESKRCKIAEKKEISEGHHATVLQMVLEERRYIRGIYLKVKKAMETELFSLKKRQKKRVVNDDDEDEE